MFSISENTKFISEDEFNKLSEEEVLKLIQPEIELIKKSFSKDQIDLLQADLINGDSMTSCIYGMMTGHCNDIKVVEVITQLPVLVKRNEEIDLTIVDDSNRVESRQMQFMTPLEEYITPKDEDYLDDNDFEDYGDLNQGYIDFINSIIKKIKG